MLMSLAANVMKLVVSRSHINFSAINHVLNSVKVLKLFTFGMIQVSTAKDVWVVKRRQGVRLCIGARATNKICNTVNLRCNKLVINK